MLNTIKDKIAPRIHAKNLTAIPILTKLLESLDQPFPENPHAKLCFADYEGGLALLHAINDNLSAALRWTMKADTDMNWCEFDKTTKMPRLIRAVPASIAMFSNTAQYASALGQLDLQVNCQKLAHQCRAVFMDPTGKAIKFAEGVSLILNKLLPLI